jgi:hypothetical protein
MDDAAPLHIVDYMVFIVNIFSLEGKKKSINMLPLSGGEGLRDPDILPKKTKRGLKKQQFFDIDIVLSKMKSRRFFDLDFTERCPFCADKSCKAIQLDPPSAKILQIIDPIAPDMKGRHRVSFDDHNGVSDFSQSLGVRQGNLVNLMCCDAPWPSRDDGFECVNDFWVFVLESHDFLLMDLLSKDFMNAPKGRAWDIISGGFSFYLIAHAAKVSAMSADSWIIHIWSDQLSSIA